MLQSKFNKEPINRIINVTLLLTHFGTEASLLSCPGLLPLCMLYSNVWSSMSEKK